MQLEEVEEWGRGDSERNIDEGMALCQQTKLFLSAGAAGICAGLLLDKLTQYNTCSFNMTGVNTDQTLGAFLPPASLS